MMARRVMDALMCKTWGCTPSQLRKEDADEVFLHSQIYSKMMKKMPHLMM